MNHVELINLYKIFPHDKKTQFIAVDQINLEIKQAEFFSLLGPSGCGKTTTLRMIAGLENPTHGEIRIQGHLMNPLPPFHRPVNTVFQNYALFPHLTIYQNIAFGLEMENLPPQTINKKVKEVLNLVQLNDTEKRYPRQLSGGQQQRVALARALVKQPQVLLFDEPLGALDLKLRKEMQLELKKMQKKLGITFIYVTHDQEEALTMSDRIAIMEQGKIQQIGTPLEIYEYPKNRFVADFIGETNFLVGRVIEQKNHQTTVLVDEYLPISVQQNITLNPGQIVTLLIRPEKATLYPENHPQQTGWLGKIENAIYIGTDTRYQVKITPTHQITVRQQNLHRDELGKYTIGQPVKVSVSPDSICILETHETHPTPPTHLNHNPH